jgi:methyl-accepting chemotaxis protein
MKPKPKNFNKIKSLTVTLAVAFLSFSLITLLLSSILELYLSFQTKQLSISKEQNLIAQNAADTVKSFIQEKYSILKTTADLSSLNTIEQLAQKGILDTLLGREPSFRQLIFIDGQNQEKAAVSRLSKSTSGKLLDKLDKTTIENLKQSKEVFSQVYIDPVTSEPMMVMTSSVQNVFGDFQGTLLAEVNLKFMWDLVGTLKIGKSGQAFVVDKKGNLLAFADINRVLKGENLSSLHEVAEFIEMSSQNHKNDTLISKGINGNTVVTNHVHLDMPDWAMVVELPIGEAYETIIYQLEFTAVIVLVILLFTIVIGLFLSKSITKPIVYLRDGAEKIKEGNFDTRIDISSNDEIGQLADSFNHMASKLQESYRDLELKVTERTTQLEESKKELENNISELEKTNKLMVGREIKMVELKKEVEELKSELNILKTGKI